MKRLEEYQLSLLEIYAQTSETMLNISARHINAMIEEIRESRKEIAADDKNKEINKDLEQKVAALESFLFRTPEAISCLTMDEVQDSMKVVQSSWIDQAAGASTPTPLSASEYLFTRKNSSPMVFNAVYWRLTNDAKQRAAGIIQRVINTHWGLRKIVDVHSVFVFDENSIRFKVH